MALNIIHRAAKKGCQVILVVAGFPCKGLSRNRIDNLQNKGFRHKESKLFSEIPRILLLLRRIAKAKNIEVHYIVENVKMPPEEHDIVCNVLNGIPTMIQASRVCASSRPRLFWTSFQISPLEGESLENGDKTNVLHLKQVPVATLAKFWDPKWGPHKNSQMPFPCVTGWQQKPRSQTPRPQSAITKAPRTRRDAGRKTAGPQALPGTRTHTWHTK